jgi:hypothetical protein
MFNKLSEKFTNNYKEVPLFWVSFDLNKYLTNGEKGSCELKLHPNFRNDKHIIETLNSLVDHIRENYDMEDLSK